VYGLSEAKKCQKTVDDRIRYLKKNCKKYGSKMAEDMCRSQQRRYVDMLKALNECFAADDCTKIANCLLKKYVPIAM